MKKTFFAVLMLCVTALGLFAQAAVVREVAGDVQLKPAGASEFSPALPGSEVAQDTIVSTGFRSTAVIDVGSSKITVQSLTRLSLAEIQMNSGAENLNMKLQSGRVKVDVKPPAGARANFTVQSPSATASVRGTSFEFDTRKLKVSEGKVSFRGNKGISMPVSSGSDSFVGNEGNAVDPVEIAESAYYPPPPPGSESGAGSVASSAIKGDFSVELKY